ncbi:MAG: hypothetical protein JSU72_06110 [Deltaproteobacteria bacterium]|nr:MAG: hypothetical protein JSU72_06110 [Deltaproteobacteria bacterium]
MRIMLAGLIWIVFVGGLALYTHRQGVTPVATETPGELRMAEGQYELEITTTFTVEPDPFALQSDEGEKPAGLLVRLGDREVLRKTDRLEAGIPIRVAPLFGLVEGTNEIYLEASPPLDHIGKINGVRVQIQRDGQAIVEQTFWSLPGGKVADTLRFSLAAVNQKESQDGHK